MCELISEQILIAYTSLDQNQRKTAEQQLFQQEESDPTFSHSLIYIYEQNNQMKFFTIMLLKNIIKRKWVAYITPCGSTKKQGISHILIKKHIIQNNKKKKLKKEFYSFIDTNRHRSQDKNYNTLYWYRNDLTIQDISRFDYPYKFPSLLHYINEQLDYFSQTQDLCLLQLLKQLFKNMPKLQQKNEQFISLWTKIAQIWLQSSMQDPQTQIYIDKIFTNLLLSYSQQTFQDQISEIFTAILQRIANLLQQQVTLYQKNIIHLIKKLSDIVIFYQFQISNPIQDYLQLLKIIINQNNPILTKTGLIAIIQFFKVKPFFLNSDQWEKSIKNKTDAQKQQTTLQKSQIDQIIKNFLENETKNLLQRFLSLLSTPNEITIEDMIEQEEENDFDQIIDPKSTETFSLALIAAEQLILRSPLISSQLLQLYVDESIKANFQISPEILESLLILIGLIPKIQQKVSIQFQIQYEKIFQFLQSSPKLNHQRRLSVLLNRLILLLDQNQMVSSLQTAGALLQKSQDGIISFQSLMCIKSVVANYKGYLQWSTILVTVSPYIVALLKGFTRTTIISPLLELLTKLIEKCQNEPREIIATAMENSGLFQLMQSKFKETEQNQLIIEQVCEMIKTIIVAYPVGSALSHLFQMAITLITHNIRSKQYCILSLILFTLQEYQSEANYQLQLLSNLILQNLDVLQNETDINNQSLILLIYEELYLLNVFSINDCQSHIPLLELRYSSNKINVKNSVLGITTTMILLLMNNQKNNDIGMFQGLLQLILNDFLASEMTDKLETKFRIEVQIVSILNRFVILARDGYLSYLFSNHISLEQYLQCWMKKSTILESEKSIKLNIIAFLLVVDQIPPILFVQLIQQISTQYTRYIGKAQKERKASEINISERLSQFRSSSRKDMLRKTQMYNESNIQQFFTETIRNYVVKNQLQNDPQVAEQLKSLI